jgi:hypothetical protein
MSRRETMTRASDGVECVVIRPRKSYPFAKGIVSAWSLRIGTDMSNQLTRPFFLVPVADYEAIEGDVRAELRVKGADESAPRSGREANRFGVPDA